MLRKSLDAQRMPGRENLARLLDGEAQPAAKNLFGLSRQQLTALLAQFGQPPYRAGQLLQAIFRQRIASLEEVSTLPRGLRKDMAASGWVVDRPRIVETFRSVDGTERYLVAGRDGQTVETVWMPGGTAPSKGTAKRRTGRRPGERLSAFPVKSAARSTVSSVSLRNWGCSETFPPERLPAR